MNRMAYFETSAKTGEQIAEAIQACVQVIEKHVADGTYDIPQGTEDAQFLSEEPEKKGCSC